MHSPMRPFSLGIYIYIYINSFGQSAETNFNIAGIYPTQIISKPNGPGLNRCQYFIKLVPHLYQQVYAPVIAYKYSFSGHCEVYLPNL